MPRMERRMGTSQAILLLQREPGAVEQGEIVSGAEVNPGRGCRPERAIGLLPRAEPMCPGGRQRSMRPHLRCAPGTMLLMAAGAAMAAGCAATHTTTTGPVTEASQAASSPTPRERAVADAAAILRAFVVPPGGQRLHTA